MFITIKHQKEKFLFAASARLIVFVLSFSLIFAPSASQAQSILNLPTPGTMIAPSPAFMPALLKGMIIHPKDPLKFDFIITTGDDNLKGEAFEKESQKLINYFLATLTVPEDEMWVNLSPYEKDRIIADGLSSTEMGRDMLAQDYMLKQLTASLMYPEKELGRKFWDKIHKKAEEKFGTSEIPVNTFNKVWILPETATVYEHEQTVYVVDAHLKVMLNSDYEAMQHSQNGEEAGLSPVQDDSSELSEQIIREIIVPEIKKEVNEGKTFANLRQMYHAMILATWYKTNLKESVLGQVYIDKNKVKGIDLEDKQIKEKIYSQYVEAFKKGVYSYIREDHNPITRDIIPRKYFSGGVNIAETKDLLQTTFSSPIKNEDSRRISVKMKVVSDEDDEGTKSIMIPNKTRDEKIVSKGAGAEQIDWISTVRVQTLQENDLGPRRFTFKNDLSIMVEADIHLKDESALENISGEIFSNLNGEDPTQWSTIGKMLPAKDSETGEYLKSGNNYVFRGWVAASKEKEETNLGFTAKFISTINGETEEIWANKNPYWNNTNKEATPDWNNTNTNVSLTVLPAVGDLQKFTKQERQALALKIMHGLLPNIFEDSRDEFRKMSVATFKSLEHSFENVLKNGAIVASLSKGERGEPDYFYNWVRDSLKYIKFLVEIYNEVPDEEVRTRIRSIVEQHIEFIKNSAQLQENRVTAKVKHDGTPVDWGDQLDSPAHIARALLDYLLAIEDIPWAGDIKWDAVKEITANLDFVVRNPDLPTHDLWEEMDGYSIYTDVLLYDALMRGAKQLQDEDGVSQDQRQQWEETANIIKNRIEAYWDDSEGRGYFTAHQGIRNHDRFDAQKPQNLDSAVIGSSMHTYGEHMPFALDDEKMLKSFISLDREFIMEFPINDKIDEGKGEDEEKIRGRVVWWARYIGDRYDGVNTDTRANPWYITSFWRVQFILRFIANIVAKGRIDINSNAYLEFLSNLGVDITGLKQGESIKKGDERFNNIISVLEDTVRLSLEEIMKSIPYDQTKSEQVDGTNKRHRGAVKLMWGNLEMVVTLRLYNNLLEGKEKIEAKEKDALYKMSSEMKETAEKMKISKKGKVYYPSGIEESLSPNIPQNEIITMLKKLAKNPDLIENNRYRHLLSSPRDMMSMTWYHSEVLMSKDKDSPEYQESSEIVKGVYRNILDFYEQEEEWNKIKRAIKWYRDVGKKNKEQISLEGNEEFLLSSKINFTEGKHGKGHNKKENRQTELDVLGQLLFKIAKSVEEGTFTLTDRDREFINTLVSEDGYLAALSWKDHGVGNQSSGELEIHLSSVALLQLAFKKWRKIGKKFGIKMSDELIKRAQAVINERLSDGQVYFESETKKISVSLLFPIIFNHLYVAESEKVFTSKQAKRLMDEILKLERKKGFIWFEGDATEMKPNGTDEAIIIEETQWTQGFGLMAIFYAMKGGLMKAEEYLGKLADTHTNRGIPVYYTNDGQPGNFNQRISTVATYLTAKHFADKVSGKMSIPFPDSKNLSSPVDVGGIDFNPEFLDFRTKQDSASSPLRFEFPSINDKQVEGVVPVIINIVPITNLPLLLGESEEHSDEFSLSQLN